VLRKEYLEYAGECLRLARECSEHTSKALLVHMAEVWKRLANKAGQTQNELDEK
jgi:hypothetical protein